MAASGWRKGAQEQIQRVGASIFRTTAPLSYQGESVVAIIAQTINGVARSPAAWTFALAWVGAALIHIITGFGFPFLSLLTGIACLLLSLFTVVLTRPVAGATAPPVNHRPLWLQLGLILLFVMLTAWNGLVFHRVVPPTASLPVWSPLVIALERLGDAWFGNSNYLANPVTYLALPLLALLLVGVRWPELGLGRGQRVGLVSLLWCAIPLLYLVWALLVGQLSIGRLIGRLISNFMQNGFFEEFLFRGALQTRLRGLWGSGWALVAQALLFGAWHLGLGYSSTDQAGLLPALASVILNQAMLGLAFGVIFERTGNLLAPSAVHLLGNSLG